MKDRVVQDRNGNIGIVVAEIGVAVEMVRYPNGTHRNWRVEDLDSMVCETCRLTGVTTFLTVGNSDHVTEMLTAREPFTGFVHTREMDDGQHVCGFAVEADADDF